MFFQVRSVITVFGRPTRVFVTQRTNARQPVTAAACRALFASTRQICSWIASDGARQEYWICAKRGARLSDVAPRIAQR